MNSRVVIDFLAKSTALRSGVNEVVGSLDKVQLATKRVRQALFVAGTALGGALTAAGYKAAQFERSMQNVNSIVQDSDKVFARTSKSVLQLATQVPRSANELAQGAYTIVSAGFTQPAQTLDILAQSGKAASAGLTSVDTAANAVVTTLNAYGTAAGNAQRVSDLLFQTVNVGQVSFEQLATNLGDFIGIANASGASLAETLSAYSSITIATGQASRSATSLQGIYRQLIKPSDALKSALEKIGVASGKQAIQAYGLQGTLERLSATVGGSEVGLAQMFQDVEGLNGVLALVGPNAAKARQNLSQFTDESKIAGATSRANAEQAKAFSYQLEQLKTSLGAFGIELGQVFLPAMKAVVFILQMGVNILNSLPGPVKTVIALLGAFAAIMGTVGITTMLWYSRLNMITKGLKVLAGTNAGMALIQLARSSAVAQGALVLLQRTTGMTGASLAAMATSAGIAVGALLAIKPAVQLLQNTFGHKKKIDDMAEALMHWGDAGDYSGTRLTQVFGEGLGKLGQDIKNFTEDNDSFIEKLGMHGVENSVRRVDELDKAFANLVQSGNINRAKAIFKVIQDSLMSQGVTQKEMNQAFNDYYKAISQAEMGNRSAADSQFALQGSVEDATAALAKATEEAEAYADGIKDLQEQARSFLSFSGILGKIEDAHKEAFDTAEKARQAMERQEQKARQITAAQNDLAKAQDKVNRLMYVTNNAPLPNTQAWRDLRDAQGEVAEAAGRLRDTQSEVNEEYKKTEPTIDEVIGAYQRQIDMYKQFQGNLVIAAKRGVPLEVIRELQAMGEEGVAMAAKLASATPEEFDKLKGVLAEKVRLESEQYQRELDLQLAAATAIARKGAYNTAEAILEEIRKIAPGIVAELPQVRAAMAALGVSALPGQVVGNFGQGPVPEGSIQQQNLPSSVPLPPGSTDPWGRMVVPQGTTGPLVPGLQVYSSVADLGATVLPGTNIIQNNTGLPEYVITAAQMQALVPAHGRQPSTTGRAGSSTSYTYKFGDIYAQDLTAAMRQADQKKRLGALAG